MDPAAPGNPVIGLGFNSTKEKRERRYVPLMTTARTAKPSYRLTNMSSTMPVPLLIIIAPNRGVHPCVRRSRTCGLRSVNAKHATPIPTTSTPRMKGMGVCKKGMRRLDSIPMRMRVTRSPRQEATGGAMLSWECFLVLIYRTQKESYLDRG